MMEYFTAQILAAPSILEVLEGKSKTKTDEYNPIYKGDVTALSMNEYHG